MSATFADHGWWLASRTAGIVGLLAITASVGLGLFTAIRAQRRPGMAVAVRGAHEQLALVGLISTALHGIALLGDPWLRPGLTGIAVPMEIGYRPVWVACGIVGGYLAALLGLTFYVRKRLGQKRWRAAHRFAVLAWVLAVVHTLGAGTDAGTAWLRTLVLVTSAPVVALLLVRISQPRPAPRAPRAQPARPDPASPAPRRATRGPSPSPGYDSSPAHSLP
jgi:sulfoxide reductase heme-binding subunit YedZ